MKLLVVRLGALGDIVHALPAVAALRRAWPGARIDWLVDRRHRAILDLARGIDSRLTIDPGGRWRDLPAAVRHLRAQRYDAALDLQGLLKSAVLARLSGAPRVIGFGRAAVRESLAASFYTEAVEVPRSGHVIRKNLALLAALGLHDDRIEVPLDDVPAPAWWMEQWASSPVALLNPGAGWPNKRWPAERFGAIAAWLRDRHGLQSAVLWGPSEEALAAGVVAASTGAARQLPRTSIADLVAIARRARLMVAGDTGPLHVAAAVGLPIVGLYGPTSPARNGPWHEHDETLSRFDGCACHHRRRCRRGTACIDSIPLDEVTRAIDRRLARSPGSPC